MHIADVLPWIAVVIIAYFLKPKKAGVKRIHGFTPLPTKGIYKACGECKGTGYFLSAVGARNCSSCEGNGYKSVQVTSNFRSRTPIPPPSSILKGQKKRTADFYEAEKEQQWQKMVEKWDSSAAKIITVEYEEPRSIYDRISGLKIHQSFINEKLNHYSSLMGKTTSMQDYIGYANNFYGWFTDSKEVTKEIEMLEKMKDAAHRTVGNYEQKIKDQTSC